MLPFKVEISHKTILFVVAVLLVGWLTYHILDIIFFIFVAFILMSAFKPTVETLENKKIPRLLAALIIYIIFLACLAALITLLLPPVVAESSHFTNTFLNDPKPWVCVV
jgi:predicted PurR-regulated permease PerM